MLRRDGKETGQSGTFVGNVRWGTAPVAGEGMYKLTIRNALGTGKFIDLYLTAVAGRFLHGFAATPNFNNAPHVVDVSKLQLDGATKSGRL